MNPQELSEAIDECRLGLMDKIDLVLEAASRVYELERLDQLQASIHVWDSGLNGKSWMFDIRRAGVIYTRFVDVEYRFESRAAAEAMAVMICESMLDGSFEKKYTHLRNCCPRCQGPIQTFSRECLNPECNP